MIDTNREVVEAQLGQTEVSHIDDFCVGRKASVTNDIAITLGKFTEVTQVRLVITEHSLDLVALKRTWDFRVGPSKPRQRHRQIIPVDEPFTLRVRKSKQQFLSFAVMPIKHFSVLKNRRMQRLKPEGFVDAADCVDDSLSPPHIDTEDLARAERDAVVHSTPSFCRLVRIYL